MRQRLWILSLVLPICGCYVPQPAPVYAPQAYPASPPGYPPPPPPYPGYSYNDGAPTIIEGGVAVPLVFFGGEWGFYDHDHHWHRAPDAVYRDLDRRRSQGPSFHAGAFSPPAAGRPGWHPPPGHGGPEPNHGGPPPPGYRPQPVAVHPASPPPE